MTVSQRWNVGLAATLALTSFGLLYASPALLTGAVIPLAYVLYGTVSSVPRGASVSVRREFDRSDPSPGDTVGVRLTVTNDCDRVLPDVRVIDGVPAELAVDGGAPRTCVALSPGESATVSYELVAKRGDHRFSDPVVRLRSLAATARATSEVAVDGETTLSCANTVAEAPLSEATLPRAGTLPTDTGGSGLEFFSTREYRPSDPMTRVDWRHYAKTGEFVTVQFREEQAVRTVLVVDARPPGRVTPQPGYPTGAELCAYAGERLYDALQGAGLVASVTAVGIDRDEFEGLVGSDGLPWVDGEESDRDARADRLFRGVQRVADSSGSDGESGEDRKGRRAASDGGPDDLTRRLLARLPPNAQVVVCTPLVDDWPVEFARTLTDRNYPHMVVSPDVTGSDTPGQRVAAIQRRLRLERLERTGAVTVGWNLEQPIDYALRLSLPHLLQR